MSYHPLHNQEGTDLVKILIADDEPHVRSLLKAMLTQKGREIVTVESGREALEQLEAQEFDLVLLDLKMKTIGGMEVLETLRRQWPDTAVIVLTAYASLDTVVEAIRHSADDYLFKPCKVDELRRSVREALRHRQRKVREREVLHQVKQKLTKTLHELNQLETDPVVSPGDHPTPNPERQGTQKQRLLQLGDLTIDLTRHVAILRGELLDLSPTQFDMLAYLVREAPRVLSPRELTLAVHEYESEPGPEEARNIARSHIYQIRERLEKIGERRDIIRTVRGVGYTINQACL